MDGKGSEGAFGMLLMFCFYFSVVATQIFSVSQNSSSGMLTIGALFCVYVIFQKNVQTISSLPQSEG